LRSITEQAARQARRLRTALGSMVGVASKLLERVDGTQRRAASGAALASMAQALTAARTQAEVFAAVAERCRAVVGATYTNLALFDPATQSLAVRRQSTLPSDLSDRYVSMPLSGSFPYTDAARSSSIVILTDRTALAASYPHLVADADRVGFQSLAALPMIAAPGWPLGALGVAWDRPVSDTTELRATLTTVASLVTQALLRARIGDAERTASRRNEAMAALAARAANATTADELAATIVTHAGAVVGARAVELARVVGGQLHLVRHGYAGDADGSVVVDTGVDAPSAAAIAAGEPVVVRDAAEFRACFPVHFLAVEPAGLVATVAVPICAIDGTASGALAVSWDHPVDPGDGLLTIVQRVAELAARALDRAAATDRSTARARHLAAFGGELSVARTVAEVVEAMLRTAAGALEADGVAIGIVDEAGVTMPVWWSVGDSGRLPERCLPLAADDDPFTHAIASEELAILQSSAAVSHRYPAWTPPFAGIESIAAFPLWTVDRRPLGVVGAAWRRPGALDDATTAILFTVARLCGQTIQRARLHDLEHHLISELQDRVTRPLPLVAGLDAAARYLPSSQGLEMGGDWYAGTVLRDGRLGVVVGDVAGHGIGAVADMAQIRGLCSALLAAGGPLDEAADQASAFVEQSTARLASAVFVIVDPRERELHFLAAGHVPPMVRQPDGAVEQLADGRRPMLGIEARSGRAATVRLVPGALVVLYTDGLIERRSEVIDVGLARLAGILEGLPSGLTASDAADAILAAALDDGAPEDDVAVLVLRFPPDCAPD
jgi:GAF domain-containing protein